MAENKGCAPILYAWAAFLAVLALGLVAYVGLSRAESNEAAKADRLVCRTVAMVVEASAQTARFAPLIITLEGERLQERLAVLNAQEPKTTWAGDKLIAWVTARGDLMQEVLFDKGCAVVHCHAFSRCREVAPQRLPVRPKERDA